MYIMSKVRSYGNFLRRIMLNGNLNVQFSLRWLLIVVMRQYRSRRLCLVNRRTYTQIHTPTMVQGGGFFDRLQYFETVLPFMESI